MQARYYDPVVGRFLSNDPVGYASGGVDFFNRYAYTFNDPVNLTDPTGMCPMCIPIVVFIIKEVAAEGASRATGGATDFLSVRRSGSNVAKRIGQNLSKKQVSRRLRSTENAKDIKSRTGTRNGGRCEFCDDAPADATDHLENTISEAADAVPEGTMTFEEADGFANNESNAADACTSCNSSKGTKKVNRGFKPKKLSGRLLKRFKDVAEDVID